MADSGRQATRFLEVIMQPFHINEYFRSCLVLQMVRGRSATLPRKTSLAWCVAAYQLPSVPASQLPSVPASQRPSVPAHQLTSSLPHCLTASPADPLTNLHLPSFRDVRHKGEWLILNRCLEVVAGVFAGGSASANLVSCRFSIIWPQLPMWTILVFLIDLFESEEKEVMPMNFDSCCPVPSKRLWQILQFKTINSRTLQPTA
jgi:hypothetical protein